MSFNHACPDVPALVIADSALQLGPIWIGAGVVLAQGAVVRSHEATVSIDNHSAVLENSSVIGTGTHGAAVMAAAEPEPEAETVADATATITVPGPLGDDQRARLAEVAEASRP